MTKIETKLDYKTILSNEGRPVNLTVTATAPTLELKKRQPIAFSVVLDRSGSMYGDKIAKAKEACRGVIRNLRPEDFFSLIIFDDQAQVVIPLHDKVNKTHALDLVSKIHPDKSTNLGAGWALGRDELRKAPEGLCRRLLLLSDGLVNCGMRHPVELTTFIGGGLKQFDVRTSTLGFGDDYDEDLMTELASVATGNFYDVATPDSLPAIFDAEIEGVLGIAVQNLRMRVQKGTFCDRWRSLGETPGHKMADGRVELRLGDLISEETQSFALALKVLPIPLGADGSQVASLEGEELLSLEFLYDEITKDSIVSRTESRLIRIKATQNPDEVKVDESVLPILATQYAAKAIRRAIRKADQQLFEEAILVLERSAQDLMDFGCSELVKDGVDAINRTFQDLRDGWHLNRSRKTARYVSRSFSKGSSLEHWSGDESHRPFFKE